MAVGSGTSNKGDCAEPTTLAEMQAMATEDFRQVDRYLWGGSPSYKSVIRHIIQLASEKLSWQGEANANSLRDFWYNPVKPILETAFVDDLNDPDCDFGRKMNQRLSMELSEMVKSGDITYRELNILDDSRKRELYNGVESDRLLFVEKEAAYRKLKPLAEVYEMSLISGGGWQSTACLEDLAHRLDTSQEYQVFVLTDYDPTGFKISNDFAERADKLGISVNSVIRLGINPNQLDNETRQKQRFKPPIENDSHREWMETHGIDGQYGLELEAIGDLDSKGKALRRMVANELQPYIREEQRIHRDLKQAEQSTIESSAHVLVEELTHELEQRLHEEARNIANRQRISPEPYDPEELHQGAIDGTGVSCATRKAQRQIKSELKQKIQTGQISVSELISADGGGGR